MIHGQCQHLNADEGSAPAGLDRVCALIFSMAAVGAGSLKGPLPYPAGACLVRYEGEGSLEPIAARTRLRWLMCRPDVYSLRPSGRPEGL